MIFLTAIINDEIEITRIISSDILTMYLGVAQGKAIKFSLVREYKKSSEYLNPIRSKAILKCNGILYGLTDLSDHFP